MGSAVFLASWGSAARAASPSVTWSVTGPAACAADVKRVTDELALACAAMGTCRIAAPGETSDRSALVRCGVEEWKVEARSANEGSLWVMDLDGPLENRPRQAAG